MSNGNGIFGIEKCCTHTHTHTSDLATANIYSSNRCVRLVFALGNTTLIVTDILMNDRKWSTHTHTDAYTYAFTHSIHINVNYMQCTNKYKCAPYQ